MSLYIYYMVLNIFHTCQRRLAVFGKSFSKYGDQPNILYKCLSTLFILKTALLDFQKNTDTSQGICDASWVENERPREPDSICFVAERCSEPDVSSKHKQTPKIPTWLFLYPAMSCSLSWVTRHCALLPAHSRSGGVK